MITLYGIKNCDTMKKARLWLNTHNIEYGFHDYRADGLSKQLINRWCKEHHWETLLNRRGTTWRNLDETVKQSINETLAIELMLQQPAMIKRPVLDLGESTLIGFSDALYQANFFPEEI
jgi:arsenate reductase